MNINLQEIGKYFSDNGLWNKRFSDFCKPEIINLCKIILENTHSGNGLIMPYVNDDDDIVIPFDCPHKYKFWAGEQSVLETMVELKVPFEVAKKYYYKDGLKLTEEKWKEICGEK